MVWGSVLTAFHRPTSPPGFARVRANREPFQGLVSHRGSQKPAPIFPASGPSPSPANGILLVRWGSAHGQEPCAVRGGTRATSSRGRSLIAGPPSGQCVVLYPMCWCLFMVDTQLPGCPPVSVLLLWTHAGARAAEERGHTLLREAGEAPRGERGTVIPLTAGESELRGRRGAWTSCVLHTPFVLLAHLNCTFQHVHSVHR